MAYLLDGQGMRLKVRISSQMPAPDGVQVMSGPTTDSEYKLNGLSGLSLRRLNLLVVGAIINRHFLVLPIIIIRRAVVIVEACVIAFADIIIAALLQLILSVSIPLGRLLSNIPHDESLCSASAVYIQRETEFALSVLVSLECTTKWRPCFK
jgi:hypothetical protein